MTAQIIKVHSDSSSLLIAAVTDFLKLVESRNEGSKQMSVVLTGGSLGIGFLKELSKQGADLSGVDFVFGDERFVGLSDDDRNEHQGILAFPALSHLNLKRFPDPSLSLQDAKNAMNKALEAHYGRVDDSRDVFDLVLLGVGPDGHVASLFPGHNREGEWVIAEESSPKPPAERLSITYQGLNRGKHVWFMASGVAKAEVVGQALSGKCSLPLAQVRGSEGTAWYLDKELSDEL